MAVKEEKTQSGSVSKGGAQGVMLTILKFAVAVLILPLVVGSTMALLAQITEFNALLRHDLWLGLVAYLVLKCFVYDFDHVYRFGQGMVTFCFQFLKPLVNAAPYVIPLYTIFVLLAYAFVSAVGQLDAWRGVLFSLMSATFSMHIILTAEDLYEKDKAFGKPTYFFSMGLVYIVDVFLIALVMNVVLPGFSFVKFFQALGNASFDIYHAFFMQFFRPH